MLSKRHLKRLVRQEIENISKENYNELTNRCIAEESEYNLPDEEENINFQNEENEGNVFYEIEQNNEIVCEKQPMITEKLRQWGLKHNLSRKCFDDLLEILRTENIDVPLSSKSILKQQQCCTRTVSPGSYLHIGLEKQLLKVSDLLKEMETLILDIGIDGLPLYKSSNLTLWPILAKIVPEQNIKVIVIGCFLGKKKPHNVNTYLHDFVNEIKNITSNGIIINNKILTVKIRSFVCDAPARAFLCQTVGHNSFHGCHKCVQIGRKVNNTTTYSTSCAILRTDQDFADRKYKEHHKGEERLLLENIGIQMVTQFPLDPMHLFDLGVTRKMLLCLLNGKMNKTKLTRQDKEALSTTLVSFVPYIPKEFARKPRSFNDILKWKAVEFRQFILYTGIAVLKNIVDDDVFYHFCLLHCAYRLLSCKKNYESNIEPASNIIKHFVKLFPIIYSEEQVTYNVHSLLHITQCINEIGFLNSFSAYQFENFMQNLKRIVKKPTDILQQIHNKLSQDSLLLKKKIFGIKTNRHGTIISFSTPDYSLTLKPPDNYCYIQPGIAILITAFSQHDDKTFITGRRLENYSNFYDEPLKSMDDLGIFVADAKVNELEEIFDTQDILYKLMCLPFENKFLYIPILHSNEH